MDLVAYLEGITNNEKYEELQRIEGTRKEIKFSPGQNNTKSYGVESVHSSLPVIELQYVNQPKKDMLVLP